jgi:hypothetical protein
MHDEHFPRGKVSEDILGAPLEAPDGCSFKALCETVGKWESEIAPAGLDAQEAVTS